jgi:hypothetical protein
MKKEYQGVVVIRFIAGKKGRRSWGLGRFGFAAAAGYFLPDVVGHAPSGHLGQPGAGIVRQAFPRPLERGCEERLLDGIFGCKKIAETANDGAEHLRRQFAQQALIARFFEGIAQGRSTVWGVMKRAHFDGHAQWSAAGARAARQPGGDLISTLRTFHIDDPVAQQKLFGFRKNAICDGCAILAGAHQLGLLGRAERSGGDNSPDSVSSRFRRFKNAKCA